MLPIAKKLLADKKYAKIFTGVTIGSFLLFAILTMAFPFSQFLLFNYFMENSRRYALLTLLVAGSVSLLLGLATTVIAYKFKHVISTDKRLLAFIGTTGALYILTYILMLSNTSYSLFSYTEMSGFKYTFVNFLPLAIIIPLSSLLIVNAYNIMRNPEGSASGLGGIVAAGVGMGCPSCGALVLSLVGVGAGLTIFPLEGLEVKVLSLALLVFASYKLNSKECLACPTTGTKPILSPGMDNVLMASVLVVTAILLFNQVQIWDISESFDLALAKASGGYGVGGADLSKVNVFEVNSTAMAVATVFPELKSAKTDQDVMATMYPTGTPPYSEELGGITFDDPVNSLNYLAKWYYSFTDEVEQNSPEVWQRYLKLAAAPRGISCEYCCGIGPQGINEVGKSKCGCQHNPALLAITLGLMRDTEYSDAEVLREVMRWKTLWFPQDMVSLGVQVSGQDPSQLKDLPGMVGGC